MKQRCFNPKNHGYKNYGARGITVSPEWSNDFWQFYKDVGARPNPKHQIDRIDNNGNYCKENVRWATQKENLNNKRTNRLFTIDGVTKTMAQWIESSGISEDRFRKRLKAGWLLDDIVNTPLDPKFQHFGTKGKK